jgi:hypothetical protein
MAANLGFCREKAAEMSAIYIQSSGVGSKVHEMRFIRMSISQSNQRRFSAGG